jgi:DNA-binding IclR family transcriptional regulator
MKSVHRAFQVIETLAASEEPLDVLEVSRRTGIARNSAQRLLDSLVDAEYVLEPARGSYRAGLRTWGLAASLATTARIRQAALPNMVGLATALMTTVTLAFLEGDEVIYTDRVDVAGDRVVPVMLNVRTHPLVTSSGRALVCERTDETIGRLLTTVPRLAPRTEQDAALLVEALRESRERGYAVAERQLSDAISGVAVPVRDETGEAVAAIGANIWSDLTADVLQRLLPSLIGCGQRTSAALGARTGRAPTLS